MDKNQIQMEALDALEGYNRSGLAISMGVGKTLIGLIYMHKLYYKGARKFLVVAPKKSVMESWKNEAVKFKKQQLLKYVTFSTYISLKKQDLDYDCIFLDECHNLLFSHQEYLDNYKGKILGLTGTPPFPKTEKGQMIDKYCPIIYEYGVNEAVDDKILNDYTIVVHPLLLGTKNDLEVKTKTGNFKTSELKNYKYWSNRIDFSNGKTKMMMRILRMKSIMGFKSKEVYAKKLMGMITDKCIVFCNTKEQAKSMCKHAYYSGNPDNEKNLDMFVKGEITKLSCVEMLSEGINIPNLKSAIVLHSYAGNSPKTRQKFGRILRLNPDDKATMHILMYNATVDYDWVHSAIEAFNSKKIIHFNGKL